jgi:hypothetical protein
MKVFLYGKIKQKKMRIDYIYEKEMQEILIELANRLELNRNFIKQEHFILKHNSPLK